MLKPWKVAGLLAYTSITRGNIGIVLLTVFILALAALNLLFVPSLLNGLVSGANEMLINTYSADIVVESDTDKPFLTEVDNTITRIESISGVMAATSRNSLGAQLTFGERRNNCVVYGINPAKETTVFQIQDWLIEGSYLSPGDQNEIMLGVQLAGADKPSIELYSRSLQNVHVGDKVTVTYANGLEKRYTVKGIFYTEFIQTDLQALVTEKEFETVSPLVKNQATSINVKLNENADAQSVMEQIRNLKTGLRVLSWRDYAGIVSSMTDSFHIINIILDIVNMLVAGVTVFIVTYIDVANRKRQIGIQRAIGITPGSIALAYSLRAVFYAIIGMGVAYFVFTYAVIPLEARYPFHFPFGNVYLTMGLAQMLRTTGIISAVAVIAAFLPAYGVIRMRIMDAIWG